MKKRILALFLAAMMLVSLLPVSAFADEGQDASPTVNESSEVTQPCEECVDEDEDGLCDVCGEEVLEEVEEEPLMVMALGNSAPVDYTTQQENSIVSVNWGGNTYYFDNMTDARDYSKTNGKGWDNADGQDVTITLRECRKKSVN